MGTISKLVAGIEVGMGIRVLGTVEDGYKYLSPCSSLECTIDQELTGAAAPARGIHFGFTHFSLGGSRVRNNIMATCVKS